MTTARPGILTTLVALASLCAGLAGQSEAFEWHRNLEDARKLAAKTERPLFVVFRCER